MRTARLTAVAAALILTAACASESALGPKATNTAAAMTGPGQMPLLYVVDDVRQPAATIPDIDPSIVTSVTVLKGRAALIKYGPEASYGVVIIRTKRAIAQTD